MSDTPSAGFSSVKALELRRRCQTVFVKETSSFGIVTEHVAAGVWHLSVWGSKSDMKRAPVGCFTSSPITPSPVTALLCRGRSLLRVKGFTYPAHRRTPSDHTPSPKQMLSRLHSMWWRDRTGGILEMLGRLCPLHSGSKTFWLKPAHHGTGWQSRSTVATGMIFGLQVPNPSFQMCVFVTQCRCLCSHVLWVASENVVDLRDLIYSVIKKGWRWRGSLELTQCSGLFVCSKSLGPSPETKNTVVLLLSYSSKGPCGE